MVIGIFSLNTVYGKTITNTIFNLNIRELDLITKLFNNLSRSILLPLGVSKNCCVRGKQCIPRSDAAECGVLSGFTLFA